MEKYIFLIIHSKSNDSLKGDSSEMTRALTEWGPKVEDKCDPLGLRLSVKGEKFFAS